MRGLWGAWAFGIAVALASSASAQQEGAPSVFDVQDQQVQSAIVTVDVESLFTQSVYGQRVVRDYTQGRDALAQENRRIAAALRAEELALAAQRAEMDGEVFRIEAEAFDEKAQGIRRAQDAKERQLEADLDAGRSAFLIAARPILEQLMADRGAFAILDRRSVLLSVGSIDVTEDALARINTTLGDGIEGENE